MSFVYFKASDTYSAVERELPVYKSVRARQSRQLDLRESILYRVGKIQSWIFCIGLPVLAILSAVGGTMHFVVDACRPPLGLVETATPEIILTHSETCLQLHPN